MDSNFRAFWLAPVTRNIQMRFKRNRSESNEACLQHQELLHALLFTNSVWVLLRPNVFFIWVWTEKGRETEPTVYSPYPRKSESLTIFM